MAVTAAATASVDDCRDTAETLNLAASNTVLLYTHSESELFVTKSTAATVNATSSQGPASSRACFIAVSPLRCCYYYYYNK